MGKAWLIIWMLKGFSGGQPLSVEYLSMDACLQARETVLHALDETGVGLDYVVAVCTDKGGA